MSLTDSYDRGLYLCLPRQPRSPEWVEQILHRLWDYGMNFPRFQIDGRQPLTWSELLAAIDVETEDRQTFRARIPQLARSGGTLLTAHDLGWPYLSFDLQEHPSLDWIVLYQDGLELEPYWLRKQAQYETPLGYLAVYQAFLEWARVLCEIVEPLFGFGYCQGYITDYDQYREYVKEQGEVPQPGWLPPIDDWFSHPPLRYLAPALLTPDLQLDLLSHNRWRLERLATGGLFVIPPDPEYTYMAYGGYSALDRSNQQGERAETQRALTIFTAIDERNGMRKTRAQLGSLDTLPGEESSD